MTAAIGAPVDRVDGPEKVTGQARYAAEIPLARIAYAAIVGAAIPSGRSLTVATADAISSDGVLAVLTHENLGKIASQPPLLPSLVGSAAPGQTFFPMQDDVIHYAGQPVSMVVADSHERAQYAASLISVDYERSPSITTIEEGRDSSYEAERLFGGLMPGRSERGDVESALAQAEVRIDATYRCAANHHNPMEAPSTTAVWEGDHLTIYDSCMGIRAVQLTVAALLGIPLAKIRVIAQFTGGGFGSKAMVWPHVALAAMAARHVGRPVKLHADPSADVHRDGSARGAGAADQPGRHPRGPAGGHPPREALDHVPLRRLGRAGDRHLRTTLRVSELPRRPPVDPR